MSVWRSIADALLAEIEQGALRGGDRLPTDIELARRFGCNKHTARRAIAHLEQEGCVRVEWGRGTFVVDGASDGQRVQAKLIETLLDSHRDLHRDVLRCEPQPATEAVARGLRIVVGSPALLLALVHQARGVPLGVATHFFPLKRLPLLAAAIEGLAEFSHLTSVTDVLRVAGVQTHRRARIRIGARLPTAAEAVQLKMARQQPLLETESVDVDAAGHPIIFALTCFRADRLQLVVPTS